MSQETENPNSSLGVNLDSNVDSSQTKPVTESSEIRDEIYFAKAVKEDGGIPVDIVSVQFDIEYKPVYNYLGDGVRNRSRTYSLAKGTMEFINNIEEHHNRIRYYSNSIIPEIKFYYKTPSEKYQCVSITPITHYSSGKYKINGFEFVNEFKKRVLSSVQHTDISDISPRNPIEVNYIPDTSMSDGKFEINGTELSFTDANMCDHTPSSSDDNITNVLEYISSSWYNSIGEEKLPEYGCWNNSYVSDVRYDDKNNIYIEVPTVFDKSVFKYNMSYNSNENPLWQIVESAGGDIVDVRGMNVCIRRRTPYIHEYCNNRMEYKTLSYEQPIKTYEFDKESIPFLSLSDIDVKPSGVDNKYCWTLGVSDSEHLIDEYYNNDDTSDENTEESLVDKVKFWD